jgi:uncharacterized protein GlcG (DUF336 family)
MIDAAERKATEMGHPFVIAVVDDSGVLKAFSRMDGAALLSVQIAQDKAYTAAGFGLSTDSWHDFIKDDAPLALGAAPGIDRLIVFGGGFPIMVVGKIALAPSVGGGSLHPGHGRRQATWRSFRLDQRRGRSVLTGVAVVTGASSGLGRAALPGRCWRRAGEYCRRAPRRQARGDDRDG